MFQPLNLNSGDRKIKDSVIWKRMSSLYHCTVHSGDKTWMCDGEVHCTLCENWFSLSEILW